MMEPIDLSTVERMVALVREIAEFGRAAIDAGGIITEARAIAALLPPPVDPDLVTARALVFGLSGRNPTDDSLQIRATLAVLRKAREEGGKS